MNKEVICVTSITYAESTLPESWVLERGAENRTLPIVFTLYVIKTENRLILVDAGCDELPGFVMRNFSRPVDALEKQDILPQSITDVIITHAHRDHIGAVHHFKNSIIYIQKDEYEKGRTFIPDDFQVRCFDDECEIDTSVKMIKIGGHSVGSCVVVFEMNHKKYVIAGDECYRKECLEMKIPTGKSCCPEKSRKFIEDYGDGSYVLLLCHDPNIQYGI